MLRLPPPYSISDWSIEAIAPESIVMLPQRASAGTFPGVGCKGLIGPGWPNVLVGSVLAESTIGTMAVVALLS